MHRSRPGGARAFKNSLGFVHEPSASSAFGLFLEPFAACIASIHLGFLLACSCPVWTHRRALSLSNQDRNKGVHAGPETTGETKACVLGVGDAGFMEGSGRLFVPTLGKFWTRPSLLTVHTAQRNSKGSRTRKLREANDMCLVLRVGVRRVGRLLVLSGAAVYVTGKDGTGFVSGWRHSPKRCGVRFFRIFPLSAS